MDTSDGEQIAEVLQSAAVLVVRHLTCGHGPTSAAVLAQLDDYRPARISVLAAACGVSQPYMTELVGRLHRQGLVARFRDPQDGRATLVDITASGQAQLLQVQRSVHDRVVELLEVLPAEDQATLSLAMRVAAPLIEQLTQVAAQQHIPQGTARRSSANHADEYTCAMDRILVGVDGSSSSTAAAVWAAGEAAMRNVELTIVHVVAPISQADTQTSWSAK
jgi:DNA-binding MarR family transcriptional regulator